MATTSYSSLFGTNGSGTQSGIGNLYGQQPAPTAPKPATTPTYQQTFAQMQQAGQARPAPPTPTAGTYTPYQGSTQAQAARAPMLQNLQAQLANPTRFDTQAFQQIRQAQQGNLNAEFGAQRSQLEEEMARRGLSSSSIGAGRYGDLAGQQARAQATLDAELLSQAAQTQAQDRLAALQAAGQFAELAGSQDLAQFEANRVGQAQSFQERLQAAMFGQGQSEFDRTQALTAANLEQTGGLSGMDLALRQQLGLGNLGLDAARLEQEGQQFGAQMQEAQAARMQQFGLSTQELGLRAEQLQQEAALQGRSLSLQEARDNAEVDLRSRQLVQEAQLQGRQLSIEEARLTAQQEQFGAQLSEQQAARLQQFGLSTQELGLRAQQLQQEAQLQGRSLSLQEARDNAEVDLRSRQLVQEAQLQGRTLDIQEAQNTARNELDAANMRQQHTQFQMGLSFEDRQFSQQLTEQREQRLQNLGITTAQLDLDAQRLQQEGALQGRSLSLQEARDQAEISYRADALAQQAQLEGRSLSLEEARQQADNAFRYDNMRSDHLQFQMSLSADMQKFAQTLEEQQAGRMQQYGLSLQELDQRAMQIAQGDRSLSLQQARDLAEVDFRAQQMVQQESQFGRTLSLDEARMQVSDQLSRDQMAMERGLREAGLEIDRNQLDQQNMQFMQGLQLDRERLSAQEQQFMQGMQLDRERMTQQGDQFTMEQMLREKLGMGDLDVRRQQAMADTQLAQNQFLLQLAQALGGLSAEQIKKLFPSQTPGTITEPTGDPGERDPDSVQTT